MWQTPLSIVSARNSTPCSSSSLRAACDVVDLERDGVAVVAELSPNASDCMIAIVTVPVSNSPAGMLPQRFERSSPSTSA